MSDEEDRWWRLLGFVLALLVVAFLVFLCLFVGEGFVIHCEEAVGSDARVGRDGYFEVEE